MYFDALYLIIALPALLLSLAASGLLHFWYGKYSGRANSKGINGVETAQKIAEVYGLQVSFLGDSGNLTDNYNPANETVTLSKRVYHEPSIASVAIAAHEMGHVMQYQSGSMLMKFRSMIIPAVNIGTNVGYFLIVFGLIIATADIVWLGIALFSLSTFFTLFTLPVEFDASMKGLRAIRKLNLLGENEIIGARMVLIGAALTYVAAAAASILNLLYFVLRARGLNRD